MTARTQKQLAFQFFFKYAGYSYDPKTQTPKEGRAATARRLAAAEQYCDAHNWRIEWQDDWSLGCSHAEFYGTGSAYDEGEPSTCEIAVLYDADNNILASLGCIDDVDDNYRRVIRAELALEAMDNEKDVRRLGLLA